MKGLGFVGLALPCCGLPFWVDRGGPRPLHIDRIWSARLNKKSTSGLPDVEGQICGIEGGL